MNGVPFMIVPVAHADNACLVRSTSENTSIHSESDHTFPTGKGSFTNLRPNVKFELANNSSVSNDLKFECYPNPTNSTVTVNHNLTSNSKIIVTNINFF